MKRLAFIFAVFACTIGIAVAEEYEIDISLETGPNHIRNIVVKEITGKIELASNGRLKFNLFHGSAKFKGKDELTALAQGALDMGVVGNWYMGAIVPDFNMAGLPMFYGLPREEQYKVWDGKTGQELRRRLVDKLGIVIIGDSIDLGFGTMFFVSKQVRGRATWPVLRCVRPAGPQISRVLRRWGPLPYRFPLPMCHRHCNGVPSMVLPRIMRQFDQRNYGNLV